MKALGNGLNAMRRPEDSNGAPVAGRRVLVTGAGGSIGAALVARIARMGPAAMVLVDASEFALYEVERGVPGLRGSAVLGSVGDRALMEEVFALHRPEIVLHAAAYKHVPLLERNPFAAVANNALGTMELLQVAMKYGVGEFVLVSTDKAVEPLSVMGASKRIAELLLLAHAGGGTRMSAVRLGNVWASQGSVVELFAEQLARGGPLTVTHPEASRYFMRMDAAVGAILAALEPRKSGTILVAEVGTARKIVEVARELIREHGSAAEVVFTGLRPGDKLVESLISGRESWANDEGTLRAVLSPALTVSAMEVGLAALRDAVASRDGDALLRVVGQLVPEYTPSAALLELTPAACA